MLAVAESGAAEVEAKDGKAEAVQRLHGVEDNLVVQRPAKQRVRMANERGMPSINRPSVQQRLQASRGTVDEE